MVVSDKMDVEMPAFHCVHANAMRRVLEMRVEMESGRRVEG